jgi:hypothetical protein
MGDQFLNSDEAIVLTTHRISVNDVLYDLMLTTRRLILIDSTYARFEPRMVPLTTLLSVTAGKVATGEPVITLSRSVTGSAGGAESLTLIFSQQPGEERRRERDVWLQRLIEDLVSARQQAALTELFSGGEETGKRPTGAQPRPIELAFPRQASPNTYPEPAEPVILPDEPDDIPAKKAGPGSQETVTPPASGTGGSPGILTTRRASPDTVLQVPPAGEVSPAPLEEEPPGVAEVLPAPPSGEKPPAGAPETAGLPDLFSSAALAVKESTIAFKDHPPSTGTLPPETPAVKGHDTQPEAEPALQPPSRSPPPAPRIRSHTVILVAALIIAILALVGGAFLLSQYLQNIHAGTQAPPAISAPTVTETTPPPAQTLAPAARGTPLPQGTTQLMAPPPVNIPAEGVWVRVAYNGTFVGWVGNPGSLQHVRGSGEQFYRIMRSDGLVQASFQKQDNSGETLTIGIYAHGGIVFQRTIRAPMGELAVLIDPVTGKPPGIPPAATMQGTTPG